MITKKQIQKYSSHKNYIDGDKMYYLEQAEFVKHERINGIEYFHFEVYLDDDIMCSEKINSRNILDSECNCGYNEKDMVCEHIVAGGLMIKDVRRKMKRIMRRMR